MEMTEKGASILPKMKKVALPCHFRAGGGLICIRRERTGCLQLPGAVLQYRQ